MKLGVEVGLEPGHIVLDGVPVPPTGAQPPIFGPCLLRPNDRQFQLLLSSLVQCDSLWTITLH